MASSDIYETTCPHCRHDFDVRGDAAEGDCPRCKTHLLFLDHDPAAPPAAPAPPAPPPEPPPPPVVEAEPIRLPPKRGRKPAPLPPPPEPEPEPTIAEPVPEPQPEPQPFFQRPPTPAVEPTPPPPPPAPPPAPVFQPEPPRAAPPPLPVIHAGEFRVDCPACHTPFGVAPAHSLGACPTCNSRLIFDTMYPTTEPQYDVVCPACGTTHSVAMSSHDGVCPNCRAALAYDDHYADDVVPHVPHLPAYTPAPAVEAQREPEPVHAPAPEPIAEPARYEPPAPSPPPSFPTGPQSLPYSLECPACSKSFQVGPGEREGVCPHCNAALAFVSEREHQALLEAEQARKELQARHHERLQRRRERELAIREGRKPAPSPKPAEAAPKPTNAPRIKALFRRRTKPDEASVVEPTAAVLSAPVTIEEAPFALQEPALASAPPLPKGKRWKKERAPPPAPAEVEAQIEFAEPSPPVATMEVQVEDIAFAEPTPQPPPEAPPKKGFLSRFRKAAPPPDDSPAATVEETAIEFGAPEPVVEAPPPLPPPPTRKGRRTKPEPVVAPVEDVVPIEIQSIPEAVAEEPATITMEDISVEVAAAPPTEPEAPKRAWWRRGKPSTPASGEEAPPAQGEMMDIQIEGTPEAAAPDAVVDELHVELPAAPPAKPKGKGKFGRLLDAHEDLHAKAPEVEIDTFAFAEHTKAPAKRGKKAPPAKKGKPKPPKKMRKKGGDFSIEL